MPEIPALTLAADSAILNKIPFIQFHHDNSDDKKQ